jgi:hypothetical protein
MLFKVADFLLDAALRDAKVLGFEAVQGMAVLVLDDYVDDDQLRAGVEDEGRRGWLRWRLCEGRGVEGCGGQHQGEKSAHDSSPDSMSKDTAG